MLSFALLVPAVAVFLLQRHWVEPRRYVHGDGQGGRAHRACKTRGAVGAAAPARGLRSR